MICLIIEKTSLSSVLILRIQHNSDSPVLYEEVTGVMMSGSDYIETTMSETIMRDLEGEIFVAGLSNSPDTGISQNYDVTRLRQLVDRATLLLEQHSSQNLVQQQLSTVRSSSVASSSSFSSKRKRKEPCQDQVAPPPSTLFRETPESLEFERQWSPFET
jgi:hypothetical protein